MEIRRSLCKVITCLMTVMYVAITSTPKVLLMRRPNTSEIMDIVIQTQLFKTPVLNPIMTIAMQSPANVASNINLVIKKHSY